MTAAETPWRHADSEGRADALLFGRMFEDWTIESSLFQPGSRVFCIASAGCTALALAGLGHDVTAADINGAQIDLLRRRLAGAPSREGAVDRTMSKGRATLRLLGWDAASVRAFLDLEDPDQQRAFWRRRFDTRRFRMALDALLSPRVLRLFYPPPLVRLLPRGFSALIRSRLERGFSTHPNRTNQYARGLLLGEWPPDSSSERPGPVAAVHADAVEYLETCPPRSYGAITLSNILDGVGPEYGRRLDAAVRRAAAPGAVVILRSFAEPENADEEAWARRDRALFWGRIRVEML
jgi:S-adenosylmethionine:diacylglycerol 3-amino-3-carboxypropyl transferase